MEDRAELEAFRLRYRVNVLERLVLKTAFSAPLLSRRLSAEQSHRMLIDWLNLNSSIADEAYGAHFQEPALAALYSDEVRYLMDQMIAIVDALYEESRGVF
jgi:hypothetical protein